MREQVFCFLVCVLTGTAGAAVYDLFLVPAKPRFLRIGYDILFSILFAAAFLAVSLISEFPTFRLYMAGGILLGMLLYSKSFHKLVAFFRKWVYNGIKAKRKEAEKCPIKSGSCRKRRQKGSPSLQS